MVVCRRSGCNTVGDVCEPVSVCVCEMQEVSVLATDCAAMLVDIAAVPHGSYRLLSQLVTETSFPVNWTALKMLNARLDEDLDVTSDRLTILVSCLLKVHIRSSSFTLNSSHHHS